MPMSRFAGSGAWPAALVFAALGVRLFRLTDRYAVNILFWDQWDFDDATLFEHHTFWEIFRWQHGPHRQGLGGILAALIEPLFRWNSRTEAFVATGMVVIAGLAMWYLKYRLFGSLAWTDVAIPMIVFSPAQWEPVWNTVNFAHGTLPALLIILYCLAWTWNDERAKYALIVALNFVTLYTGFGFFIGLLTPVLLFARYRAARSAYLLVCTLAAAASLLSFFAGYNNDPSSGCSSLFDATAGDYAGFLALLYATPFGIRSTALSAILAGGLVLAAVGAIAAVNGKHVLRDFGRARGTPLVLAILSAYSILFCVSAAVGRACTGLEQAHTSRYAAYRQLAVLCLYFCALAWRPPRWRVALPAVLVVLLIPSLFLGSADARDIAAYSDVKKNWRDCYLGGGSIEVCNDKAGPIYPKPERTHLPRKLDYLRASRQNLFADAPEVRK
jgi:hypothetical protein